MFFIVSYFGVVTRGLYIQEGAQTAVGAEMTTSLFASHCPIANLTYGVEANEGGAVAFVVQALGLNGGTECASFSAMRMYNDFRLSVGISKIVADEVCLCFNDCELTLCSALQDEPRAQVLNIGHVRHI